MYKAGDVVVNRRGDVVTIKQYGYDFLNNPLLAYVIESNRKALIIGIFSNGNCTFNKGNSEYDIVGYAKMTPKIHTSELDDKLTELKSDLSGTAYLDANGERKNIGHIPEQFFRNNHIKTLSNRGNDWEKFSRDVLHHIEAYTIPQYGDAPNDMLSNESPEYLMKQVQKYLNRFGKNQREGQELLDFIKMTHCIQIAYSKLKEKGGD